MILFCGKIPQDYIDIFVILKNTSRIMDYLVSVIYVHGSLQTKELEVLDLRCFNWLGSLLKYLSIAGFPTTTINTTFLVF